LLPQLLPTGSAKSWRTNLSEDVLRVGKAEEKLYTFAAMEKGR